MRLTTDRRCRSLPEKGSSGLPPRGPPVLLAGFAGTALDQRKRQQTRHRAVPQC